MTEESQPSPSKSVSYLQLGIVSATFVLGFLGGLYAYSATTASQTQLSPMELLGFVLSVLLAGASIVLAISAITLGRSSERAVITRSDESIRLQNEVHTRTTEALQRIEASTGVTEKRIEDIISGRVGDISHDIARTVSRSRQSPQELEADIKQSIMHSMKSKETEATRENKRRLKMEREETYQDAHKKALLAFANKNGVTISKLEHGSPGKSGEALFDGLFCVNDHTFAVSTFRPHANYDTLRLFILDAATEIDAGFIKSLVLVLFTEADAEPSVSGLDKTLGVLPEELREHLQIVTIDYDNIDDAIAELELSNESLHRSGEKRRPVKAK